MEISKDVNSILIAVMFTQPLQENFSYFKVTGDFKETFSDLFEGIDPMPFAPGVQSAPPEIPRYILRNDKNQTVEFTFSGFRFDFRFSNINQFTPNNIQERLIAIQSVLKHFDLKPFRLGVVVGGNIISKTDSHFLENHLQLQQFSNSNEVQLSYRDISVVNGYNMNEWFRYRWLVNNKNTEFELDINTMEGIESGDISIISEIFCKKIGDFIV